MKWENNYLYSGILMLMAVLFLYLLFPSFNPLIIVCGLLILIITGFIARIKWYNKTFYLALITTILLVTLVVSFILNPPPIDPKSKLLYYGGTGIFVVMIGLMVYVFINKFEKNSVD